MYVFRSWSKWVLLNLGIVAAAGVLLRYKILFPLPVFDFKNLLHAHSHFAFSGWVSLGLFVGIAAVLAQHTQLKLSVYSKLFALAQVAAFGMLLTFPFMGYKAPSIAFSTLSIFISYSFTWFAWKDINRSSLSKLVAVYFKAGLSFYSLSSIGAFYLAWLMASKTGTQNWYIGSVYFFLHFQYNGWFLFAVLGLFFHQLQRWPVVFNKQKLPVIFHILFASCFPAVLLSMLWMQLPAWLYWLSVATALAQLAALGLLWKFILPLWKVLRVQLHPVTRWLWLFAFVALSGKFLLQALSVIPALSYLAFGFRPIVIGYLHLIFLGFASFFILGYMIQQQLLPVTLSRPGILLFTGGALLNEIFLLAMGIAALDYRGLPVMNYFLLGAALMIFTGLVLLLASCHRKKGTSASTGADLEQKPIRRTLSSN